MNITNSKMPKSKQSRGAVIALLSSFAMSSMGLLLTPAVYDLSRQFPDVSYGEVSMLATIPNLLTMAVSFLLATNFALKLKNRYLLTAGLTCFVIGGVFPILTDSFLLTMFARVLFGIGYGLIINQTNVISIKLYEGKQLTHILSAGNVLTNIICMLSIIAGGFISGANVRYIWLVHLVAAFPLIMVILFLPDPESREENRMDVQEKGDKTGRLESHEKKAKMPFYVYLVSSVYGVAYMISKAVMLSMSSIIITEGLGTAAITGVLLSLNRGGGFVGGACFPLIYQKLKGFTIPVCLVVQTVDVIVCWRTHNLILMGAGIVILGFIQYIIHPTILSDMAKRFPDTAGRAASFVMGVVNLGGFLPSLYLSAVSFITGSEDLRFALFFLVFISTALTIVWWIQSYHFKKD